jgi:hypothetical protein
MQVSQLKEFLKEKTTILSKLRKKKIEYETIMNNIGYKRIKEFSKNFQNIDSIEINLLKQPK